MSINTCVPPEARALIETRLASLADDHQIDILHACESGSRAWGFPSPDSDYDVRFIYVHPRYWWYLTLEEGRDVIDPAEEESPAGLLDIGGWDLRKTLRLLYKSNPVVWEWLQSPIEYRVGRTRDFRDWRGIFDSFYSPIKACHHYLSLCRNTMNQALNGPDVTIKKYFYMLRPLLAAAWIVRYRTVPPMELAQLLALLDDQPAIKDSLSDLQARKRHIDEQIPIARVAILDEFLTSELNRLQEAAPQLPEGNGDKADLDRVFRYYLGLL